MKVSVIMPCLNEEKTIGLCVKKAKEVLEELQIKGEVIVVDNESEDNSAEIARKHGARVICEPKKGYGNAYLRGFREATGDVIVMADSDGTYDFYEMPKFLEALNDADFVIGSRLKGKIENGAMQWLHRYIGNPLLTKILNALFGMDISDAHCGMRAFKKDSLEKLNLKTPGMEFASEMIIKAVKSGLKIKEVPISYYPRYGGKVKLHTFQDGWRHIRFMFLYQNTLLFLVPGVIIFLIGLSLLLTLATRFHSMIFGSMLAIVGFQIITLGLYSNIYAVIRGMDNPNRITRFFLKYNFLEYGILMGFIIFLAGAAIGLRIFLEWIKSGFAALSEFRNAILSSTFAIIGLQIIFVSLFISVLLLEKSPEIEQNY